MCFARAGGGVVPDEALPCRVDEDVAGDEPAGKRELERSGTEVDDLHGTKRAAAESEQRAVGERELARGAVER